MPISRGFSMCVGVRERERRRDGHLFFCLLLLFRTESELDRSRIVPPCCLGMFSSHSHFDCVAIARHEFVCVTIFLVTLGGVYVCACYINPKPTSPWPLIHLLDVLLVPSLSSELHRRACPLLKVPAPRPNRSTS